MNDSGSSTDQTPLGALCCPYCEQYHKSSNYCECPGAKHARDTTLDSQIAQSKVFDVTKSLSFLHVGMLGVVGSSDEPLDVLKGKQIRMIEARILRIEEALKRLGVDLDSINLSNI